MTLKYAAATNLSADRIPAFSVFVLFVVLLLAGMACASVGGSTFNLTHQQLAQIFTDLVTTGSVADDLATQLIYSIRLPRVMIAAAVGAALAIAGALMQGITRNPLASPALFGLNSGAACMLVLAETGMIPLLSQLPLVLSTATGAAFAGVTVLALGGGLRGKLHPTRMVLAGIALSALLLAITRTVLILDEQAQQILSWLAGSLTDVGWDHWQQLWPWILSGIIASICISHKLNILALGDEMATGLGTSAWALRLWASLAIILLTATGVAITGPISFVGLLVPHLSRRLVGNDYRILIPVSALLGAALLCWADLLSRYMAFPSETPVGLVTALIGAPCFIWLASRGQERT
ncbi:FecCD family ABC transporter permease [Aliamphritea ceti]|uniref:FecCD family ABC transporter permease n=1 Tax=Aliamphritea ceti TaxID=1524258 RepID=UPI0021C4A4B5|nr:iron chelate uptake ABC transporter family permease subunit [Aliamphritea ceti]